MESPTVWDELPGSITPSCCRFMKAAMRNIDFVYFITQVAARQDEVRKVAIEALLAAGARNEDERSRLLRERDGGDPTTEQLRRYSDVIYEMWLTRSVDNYLVYVSELLSAVFRTRPETLRSNEQVRLDFVLEHSNMDDLVHALAERRAYAGMAELVRSLRETMGFELFDNAAGLQRAIRIIEDRNLIVHNRGVVNRTYRRRVPDAPYALDDQLRFDFDSMYDDVEFLAAAALSADKRATEKWSLAVEVFAPGGAAIPPDQPVRG
jgi:hypothetical protein